MFPLCLPIFINNNAIPNTKKYIISFVEHSKRRAISIIDRQRRIGKTKHKQEEDKSAIKFKTNYQSIQYAYFLSVEV